MNIHGFHTGYRIVEFKDGKVYSLFHGTNGSREIPLDKWVFCNRKSVRDGSGGTYYESGFHFIESLDDCIRWFEKTFKNKKNRIVVKCYFTGNVHKKYSHSKKHPSMLADWIYIPSQNFSTKE